MSLSRRGGGKSKDNLRDPPTKKQKQRGICRESDWPLRRFSAPIQRKDPHRASPRRKTYGKQRSGARNTRVWQCLPAGTGEGGRRRNGNMGWISVGKENEGLRKKGKETLGSSKESSRPACFQREEGFRIGKRGVANVQALP